MTMSESIDKYKDKENYIVPMTVAQKAGHLHAVILAEMAEEHITGKRVVHVGCNAATTTYHVQPLNPSHLAGVDVNPEAIAKAKLILPEAELITASAHDMPFEDDSFDTIILFAVFEHLFPEDKAPAVEEFQRILKPGGCVLVQLPTATPGSKDEKLKQNAYDPHHMSFYFKEQDVHDDFPGWDCLDIHHEARRNPNNNAQHSAWIAVYQNPKTASAKKNPSAQIRSGMSYGNSHDY
jgi:ubiquinone/menaquinone biosynthesis C-methylase UbiE